uniref:Acylphosphatase-like domain-containing protein n=1 Tax=Ascaris lumbricoides TaxID=6252 RepID=A0A0M3IA25_ASCLU
MRCYVGFSGQVWNDGLESSVTLRAPQETDVSDAGDAPPTFSLLAFSKSPQAGYKPHNRDVWNDGLESSATLRAPHETDVSDAGDAPPTFSLLAFSKSPQAGYKPHNRDVFAGEDGLAGFLTSRSSIGITSHKHMCCW